MLARWVYDVDFVVTRQDKNEPKTIFGSDELEYNTEQKEHDVASEVVKNLEWQYPEAEDIEVYVLSVMHD